MTLENEYPTVIRGLKFFVTITEYLDIAYIVDKYDLVYLGSKLKKDDRIIARFKNK